MCEKDVGIVMSNLAALYKKKNRGGEGADIHPPRVGVRVNKP